MTEDGRLVPRPPIRRVPGIDGLRALAILSVILLHCVLATPSIGVRGLDRLFAALLTNIQPIAIDLFFAISGYLITLILDKTRDAQHSLRTFYIRRVLRIIPLYYGVLLTVAILVILRHPSVQLFGKPRSLLWLFTFTTNFAVITSGRDFGSLFTHFWTLAFQEQFYLLWPLVILLQPARKNVKTCLLALGLSALTRIVVATGTSLHWFVVPFYAHTAVLWFVFTPTHLDGLAAGSLAALLERHHPAMLKKIAPKVIAIAPIGAVLTLMTVFLTRGNQELSVAIWVDVMPFLSSVFFASLIGVIALGDETTVPGWMASPALASVARYSYGMYVFHFPLIRLVVYLGFAKRHVEIRGYDLPYQLYFFVAMAAMSYGIGFVSWHLYEKHFVKLAPAYRYPARSIHSETRRLSA